LPSEDELTIRGDFVGTVGSHAGGLVGLEVWENARDLTVNVFREAKDETGAIGRALRC